MSSKGVMERFLSLSAEEKASYLPETKYEMTSDVHEGDLLIKNVPHISYVAPDLDKSFVPPDVRKIIIDYVKSVRTDVQKISKKNPKVVDYSEIKSKVYAIH